MLSVKVMTVHNVVHLCTSPSKFIFVIVNPRFIQRFVAELPLLTGQKVGKVGKAFSTFIQKAPMLQILCLITLKYRALIILTLKIVYNQHQIAQMCMCMS